MEFTTGYNVRIARYQRPVLIYNSAAGKLRRNPQRILHRTIEALERAGVHPRLAPTSGPGDATRLAAIAVAEGADLILALGGDGTINEIINGMAGSAVPLAVLPAGTANVVATELRLSRRPERAAVQFENLIERRIALGRLLRTDGSSRYFLSMAGAGLDARIVFDLHPGLKLRTGKLAYWLSGFGQIVRRVENLKVKLDGRIYQCGFALASRVRNYGGDLQIARGASLLRDEFEVVMFEGSNPLRYAWYMLGVSVRQVQAMPGVHTFPARRVELAGDLHVQVDGEYAGRLPVSLEIAPAALTLLMPANYR